MAELRMFKDAMYGGAGPEELSAGLLAIDFLTRASTLGDTAKMFVEAAVDEAHMRIDLMLAREAEQMTEAERIERLKKALKGWRSSVERVQKLIEYAKSRFETYEELHDYLKHLNEERQRVAAKGDRG